MQKSLVITLSDTYAGKAKEIADLLSQDGLQVAQVFDFGVIIGTAPEEKITKLREHKAVIALNEEKQAKIAPPEDDIQ